MSAIQQLLVAQTVSAAAGPAFTVAGGTIGNSVSSLSVTLTPTGSNRLCVVITGFYQSGRTISGCTVGGSSATQIAGYASNFIDGSGKTDAWTFIAPANSSTTITVTYSGSVGDAAMSVACFSGVNQSTPTGTPSVVSSNTATGTTTPASNVGELVVMLSAYYNSPGSDGSGQTLANAAEPGSPNLATRISYKAGAATSTTMTETGSAGVWGVGIALKP
jgi:hypothetical protein